MGASRTSLPSIVLKDQDTSATILFAAIGVAFSVILALWILVDGFSRPLKLPDSDVDLTIVFLALSVLMGPTLLVASIAWLLKRTRTVRNLLSNGVEASAEVMMLGPPGLDITRCAMRLRYKHGGRDFDERIVLGQPDHHIWKFMRVGDIVTIVIDPDNPRTVVLRDSYMPKESVIERMTTECQLCGKTIRQNEYTEHFMKEHSGER